MWSTSQPHSTLPCSIGSLLHNRSNSRPKCCLHVLYIACHYLEMRWFPSVFKDWRALKFQFFSWRVGSNPRRQSKNIKMKYKTHIELVHQLYDTCFQFIWRIKNQPSNSSSCSDNALRLFVLVAGGLYWRLHVTSSFSIWGCVLKGCLERGIFWRAKSCLKNIEDFNLEHWFPYTHHYNVSNSKCVPIVETNVGLVSTFLFNTIWVSMMRISHFLIWVGYV